MQNNKRFGALSSSEDPQKLADTVKGIIMGLSVLILWGAHLLGLNIVSADISNFAIGAGTAASSLWVAYGLIKKFVIYIHDLVKNGPKPSDFVEPTA